MKIFKIGQDIGRDKVTITPLGDINTDDMSTAWTAIHFDGQPYILQYTSTSGVIALLTVDGIGATHHLEIERSADIITSFALADRTYLISYTKDLGAFQVRELRNGLSLGKALGFRRTHEPGITAAFTTVGVFDEGNRAAFMGYDHESGRVAIFDISATARGVDGGPPILIQPTWSHMWATGWTRFAFFALGDETFFLKTNDLWRNVNIDHINGSHALGTNEVATRMTLVDAYDITRVAPLSLGQGDPYFVAYRPDGHTVVYRIHADCKDWTKVAEFAGPANAKALQCFSKDGEGHIILI